MKFIIALFLIALCVVCISAQQNIPEQVQAGHARRGLDQAQGVEGTNKQKRGLYGGFGYGFPGYGYGGGFGYPYGGYGYGLGYGYGGLYGGFGYPYF